LFGDVVFRRLGIRKSVNPLVVNDAILDRTSTPNTLALEAGLLEYSAAGQVAFKRKSEDAHHLERSKAVLGERVHRCCGDAPAPEGLTKPIEEFGLAGIRVRAHEKPDAANDFAPSLDREVAFSSEGSSKAHESQV
jgi:hypothetical protein